MEFVYGMSLRQLLQRRKGPFSYHVALPIIEALCEAVAHLHAQKPRPILFRDLKPSNVMVSPIGTVKLIDFGICRVVGNARVDLPVAGGDSDSTVVLGTRADTVCLGTPGYAAPEQYPDSDLEPDVRADVYALGVLLWELLTGQRPPAERRPLAPIQIYQAGAPNSLQAIVDRATRSDREQRYPSSRMMLSAIQEAVPLVVDSIGFEEFSVLFRKQADKLPDLETWRL